MSYDLGRLLELAETIGPEEWEAGPLPESTDPERRWWGVGIKDDEMGFVAQVPSWEADKARFIAATDPQTVLKLIAEMRQLRNDQENWHAYLRWRGEQDRTEQQRDLDRKRALLQELQQIDEATP